MVTPTPYPDLAIGDYHAMANVSPSKLKAIARSPLHFYAAHVDPTRPMATAPTAAMVRGSALHIAALEPHRWDEAVAVAPITDRRTKVGKLAWEQFQAASSGRLILSADDAESVRAMATAIRQHPAARFILEMEGLVEQSYTWTDPTTGLPCKCRPDWHDTTGRIVVDVKTTSSGVGREEFSRTIHSYGYHLQAAWNVDALGAEQFLWICVEPEPPYAVAVYPASTSCLDAGRRRITSLLATLAECYRTNSWPGPAGELIADPIDLPTWNHD